MTMTSVECPHCERMCGNLAGLSAHMRSMHPDKVGNHPPAREAPPGRQEPPASNGLVWEEPPRRGRPVDPGLTASVALIPELRRNPKRWARLYTWRVKSSASNVALQLRKREELEDVEFQARTLPDGTSALYGRYTGE